MPLTSTTNKINALGIFGRLDPDQEKLFKDLEQEYSKRPEGDDSNDVFNHLSLVINNDVRVGEIPRYIDLLRELKEYLPLRLNTSGVIIREDMHLALTFDTSQTEQVRNLAEKLIGSGIIETFFTKVVWFVPEQKQNEVTKKLNEVKEMIFADFILVANKQNDEHTIYSSNRYQLLKP